MSFGTHKRLSVGPLFDACKVRYGPVSNKELGRITGIGHSNLRAWHRRGHIRLRTGEDFCDAAGIHPLEVWG